MDRTPVGRRAERPPEPFPPAWLARADDSDDRTFYAPPRFTTHIDDHAIAAVGTLYEELRLADGEVLDLMSSWVSHFTRIPRHLTGLGMNSAELAANPALHAYVVHDLNADPRLPFPDAAFDAVVCCVSIDYLTRPAAVLGEVRRTLRPGGRLVVTWSNRCFPTKAVHAWLIADDKERIGIVSAYAGAAGLVVSSHRTVIAPGGPGDPLWAVIARRGDRRGPGGS